jgi:hypothetical protein
VAYKDFTFPKVLTDLGLTLREGRLFDGVRPLDPGGEFRSRLTRGVALASAIGNEKARSEFVIAPVLFHLRGLLGDRFGLFTGVELDVDRDRGLNGYCDFLLTRDPRQMMVYAPILAVAEAKNDNARYGLGQCVAEVVAARDFNRRAGGPIETVFGTSTTGTAWQFLRLDEDELTIDPVERPITEVDAILGILRFCVTGEGGPT